MVQIRSSDSGRLGMTCWSNQVIVTMLLTGKALSELAGANGCPLGLIFGDDALVENPQQHNKAERWTEADLPGPIQRDRRNSPLWWRSFTP